MTWLWLWHTHAAVYRKLGVGRVCHQAQRLSPAARISARDTTPAHTFAILRPCSRRRRCSVLPRGSSSYARLDGPSSRSAHLAGPRPAGGAERCYWYWGLVLNHQQWSLRSGVACAWCS